MQIGLMVRLHYPHLRQFFLDDAHPFKLHFRFLAVDHRGIHILPYIRLLIQVVARDEHPADLCHAETGAVKLVDFTEQKLVGARVCYPLISPAGRRYPTHEFVTSHDVTCFFLTLFFAVL